MSYFPERPLIVQSDRSILLEVQNPLYEQARDSLSIPIRSRRFRFGMPPLPVTTPMM
jgi:hypothetical protein